MGDVRHTHEQTLQERAPIVASRLQLAASSGDGPLTAVELAMELRLTRMSHETMRRRIRDAVKYARETNGERICADGDGYWMARSAQEWADYKAAVGHGVRYRFVAVKRAQAAVTHRMNGQAMLFGEIEATRHREEWATV